jgi:hypothetical protein
MKRILLLLTALTLTKGESVMMRTLGFLTAFVLLTGRVGAGPLHPSDFASLGTLNPAAGSYSIVTDGPTPTFTVGSTIYNGVLFNEGTTANPNYVAVFDFSGITIGSGVTLTATGVSVHGPRVTSV